MRSNVLIIFIADETQNVASLRIDLEGIFRPFVFLQLCYISMVCLLRGASNLDINPSFTRANN